jgi:hypothetical protein
MAPGENAAAPKASQSASAGELANSTCCSLSMVGRSVAWPVARCAAVPHWMFIDPGTLCLLPVLRHWQRYSGDRVSLRLMSFKFV